MLKVAKLREMEQRKHCSWGLSKSDSRFMVKLPAGTFSYKVCQVCDTLAAQ
mgnify:CR=1 FL=1